MTKFALFALVLVGASIAQARPSTTRMTCDEAFATVQEAGAIVLNTGGHTYDRFVAHQGYCSLGETTRPAWVPTLDVAQCFVGYVCSQDNNSGNGN